MGAPQISFFAYYMDVPSDIFLCILYGGPLRSVSSLTIWGPPTSQFLRLLYGAPWFFFIFYALNYPWGPPYFEFPGWASVPSCPPPCGRPWLYCLLRLSSISAGNETCGDYRVSNVQSTFQLWNRFWSKRRHWYDCDQVGSYCIRIMHRFHP